MLLLSLMLACGSKTLETETVTTGESSPVTTEMTATVPNKDKTVLPLSAPSTTSKSINTTSGTASTSATVTFVKPAETTTETEEIPMDDHTEENPEE